MHPEGATKANVSGKCQQTAQRCASNNWLRLSKRIQPAADMQARATRAGWSQEASRHKGGHRSKRSPRPRKQDIEAHQRSTTTDGALGGAPFGSLYATQNVVTDTAFKPSKSCPCYRSLTLSGRELSKAIDRPEVIGNDALLGYSACAERAQWRGICATPS